MNDTLNYKYKDLWSKWLFSVVVLLGLFTFSGLTPFNQGQYNKQQTTLIVNSRVKVSKSITYSRALVSSLYNKYQPASTFIDISRIYSQQVQTRLAELSVLNFSACTALFYRSKNFPHYTGKGPDILIG